jgi:hypothetical protein
MDLCPRAFEKIIAELERRPVEYNRYRKGAGAGRSQTFGIVKKRFEPQESMYGYGSQCYKRPYLYKLILDFVREYSQQIPPFNSIQLNQNYACQPHRDRGNVGSSTVVAFGDYTGGELVMGGEAIDVRNRFITADFSAIIHSVNPILMGNRFSMVFFTSPIAVDLPPPSVRLEDGKWFFYRGAEKVYYDKWKNSTQYKNNQGEKKLL